jgi:hypothetical protein
LEAQHPRFRQNKSSRADRGGGPEAWAGRLVAWTRASWRNCWMSSALNIANRHSLERLPTMDSGRAKTTPFGAGPSAAQAQASPVATPRRRKGHRGGKKKKARRKSFAAPPDDNHDELTSEMGAAREGFYSRPGQNLSNTSIDSETLLDHRCVPRLPPTHCFFSDGTDHDCAKGPKALLATKTPFAAGNLELQPGSVSEPSEQSAADGGWW